MRETLGGGEEVENRMLQFELITSASPGRSSGLSRTPGSVVWHNVRCRIDAPARDGFYPEDFGDDDSATLGDLKEGRESQSYDQEISLARCVPCRLPRRRTKITSDE